MNGSRSRAVRARQAKPGDLMQTSEKPNKAKFRKSAFHEVRFESLRKARILLILPQAFSLLQPLLKRLALFKNVAIGAQLSPVSHNRT